MRLHATCYYRSKSDEWTDSWRNEDYSALKLVKAVKGLEFKGTADLTLGGTNYTIENTSAGRERAMYIASADLAGRIARAGYERASVVPVPSSSHTDPKQEFTCGRLANAIEVRHQAFKATPVLFFDEPLSKSRGGGSRNPIVIQQHLRQGPGILTEPVVLLDDVCTSGGHLIAAARFLRSQGVHVADAFVVGRTAWKRPAKMFGVEPETLDTSDLFDGFGF